MVPELELTCKKHPVVSVYGVKRIVDFASVGLVS